MLLDGELASRLIAEHDTERSESDAALWQKPFPCDELLTSHHDIRRDGMEPHNVLRYHANERVPTT